MAEAHSQTIPLVITGLTDAGVTEFIRAISDIQVISGKGMDFGYFDVDALHLVLLGMAYTLGFNKSWNSLVENVLGGVLLVDSTKPEMFPQAKLIHENFVGHHLSVVVAVNKHDLAGESSIEKLREALGIDDPIKIVPYNATDREKVKYVLLELCYSILNSIENGNP